MARLGPTRKMLPTPSGRCRCEIVVVLRAYSKGSAFRRGAGPATEGRCWLCATFSVSMTGGELRARVGSLGRIRYRRVVECGFPRMTDGPWSRPGVRPAPSSGVPQPAPVVKGRFALAALALDHRLRLWLALRAAGWRGLTPVGGRAQENALPRAQSCTRRRALRQATLQMRSGSSGPSARARPVASDLVKVGRPVHPPRRGE